MSDGVAKVNQQPIAEIFRNVSTEFCDDRNAGSLIRAHYLAHLFGITLLGQRRRADEITEHYRQLAALSRVRGTCAECRMASVVDYGQSLRSRGSARCF